MVIAMNIISFDIGIKNLAYCILQVSADDGQLSILDWNVINLLEVGTNSALCPSATCTHLLNRFEKCENTKGRKKMCKPCGKKAVLTVSSGAMFCPRHAKIQTDFLLPSPDIAATAIKRLKVDELRAFAKKHGVTGVEESSLTKPQLLEKTLAFFETRRLKPIPKPKVKNSNQTDLVQIGKRIKLAFGEIRDIPIVTHVLIENQISTVASRMKTIQGMVAQYFIMQLDDPVIEFISSSNKLKNYVKPEPSLHESLPKESLAVDSKESLAVDSNKIESLENTFYPTMATAAEDTDDETTTVPLFDKKVYQQHKKDGIHYCLNLLKENSLNHWAELLTTHKKKDDLADSFLQGYWYLQKSKTAKR